MHARLRHCCKLYRGDLFEGEPFVDWCAAENEVLHDAYVHALDRLTELYAPQGHEEERLWCLQRAMRASPFREDLLVAELTLLERLGRPHEAVVAYGEYQRRMVASLSLEPSAEVRAHHVRLLKTIRERQ